MRKTFRRWAIGTPEYVVEHADYMASRGRNPSVPFMGIKNPQVALAVAHKHLNDDEWQDAFEESGHFLETLKVSESGWLIEVKRKLHVRNFIHRALERVSRGEDPGYYDESNFFKVDPKHAGKHVFLYSENLFGLYGERANQKTLAVYLENGIQVPVEAHKPLALAHWGKVFPMAA